MKQERLLVVDADPVELNILTEYLEDGDYLVDHATDFESAWEKLNCSGARYGLLILDYASCQHDDAHLLEHLRHDSRCKDYPVVLQIPDTDRPLLQEGFRLGVRYYLNKPYQPESTLAIVHAAIADSQRHTERVAQVQSGIGFTPEPDTSNNSLVYQAQYSFRTLDEVNRLVPILVAYCPVPEKVINGLYELMVNAVEHGNLGITYQEKAMLRWEDNWEAEILRRLALPEYRQKQAYVKVEEGEQSVVYTIVDEGHGFDWHPYLDFDENRACDPNGRGIAMARLMSFSELTYCEPGNKVVATVHFTD